MIVEKTLLSAREFEILRCISAFVAARGFPPKLEELGDMCGISYETARTRITRLQTLGYIAREPKRARSLRVLRDYAVLRIENQQKGGGS